MADVCEYCGTPVEQPATGRPRKWCSDRCRKAAGPKSVPAREGGEPIAPAVEALLGELEFAPNDPRKVAAMLLRMMAKGLDDDPGWPVALAREVRMLLAFISAADVAGPGEVDQRRVDFLRRRLMSEAGR